MATQYRPRVFNPRRLYGHSKRKNGLDDQELEASVDAYLKMLSLEQSNQTFRKADENRLLREGPLSKRSASSVGSVINFVFGHIMLKRCMYAD